MAERRTNARLRNTLEQTEAQLSAVEREAEQQQQTLAKIHELSSRNDLPAMPFLSTVLDGRMAAIHALSDQVKQGGASWKCPAPAVAPAPAIPAADEITTLLDGYDVRSGGRTGIKDLLARIRVASDTKNTELISLTAQVVKLNRVNARGFAQVATLQAQVEALKADAPKQIVRVKKEPTEVGDAVVKVKQESPPRLVSHAHRPAKISRPSTSSGGAGGAASAGAQKSIPARVPAPAAVPKQEVVPAATGVALDVSVPDWWCALVDIGSRVD